MNAHLAPADHCLPVSAERGARHPVRLAGHAALEDGTICAITVVDLSYDGCGLECSVVVKAGEILKLAVVRKGAIRARVRWCRAGKVGLIFEPQAQPDKGQLPRRSERIALAANVTLRRHGRHGYRVRAYDASANGCKVEFVERPGPQECVWVRFEGLEPIEARVCWLNGPTAGLEFSRPIHPAVFDLMVERLRQRQA
jgi:hypothetical protein